MGIMEIRYFLVDQIRRYEMNCKDTIFEDNGFFMFTAKIIKDQKTTYVPPNGFSNQRGG